MPTRKPGPYSDGRVDTPLDFELPAAPTGVERQRPAPVVAWADCPLCSKTFAALVAGGAHLTWRPHDVVTWGATHTPCRASGVALCELQPREAWMLRKALTKLDARQPQHDGGRVMVAPVCRCGRSGGAA